MVWNWKRTKNNNVMISLRSKNIPYAVLIQPVTTKNGESRIVVKLCELIYSNGHFTYDFNSKPTWFNPDEFKELLKALAELV